ncbi:MAG: fumarylacetoacetate hydrolase family protein [Bacillota bacterium]
MKIARFMYEKDFHYGKVEPGEGTITKLGGEIFGDYYLTEKTFSLSEVCLLPPVTPPNIIAIGLNYRQHAKESGHSLPDHPVIFLKATTSLTGPETRIKLPLEAPEEVDYEAELAVVIGKKAKNISRKEVSEYVLGYTCANDVSARDCQKRYDKQWARAKSFDTFCPLGPWMETEVNPDDLRVKSILNDQVMQDSRTSDMIFGPRELISYCSQNMTLLPGTVILTGTPEGVGMGRDPHVYLEAGDEIKIDIEGIGVLKNTVAREKKKKQAGK